MLGESVNLASGKQGMDFAVVAKIILGEPFGTDSPSIKLHMVS